MEYVIVTGISGAGKSTALKIMEDIGYFCVDNLPVPLIEKFVEISVPGGHYQKVAMGIDIRSGEGLSDMDRIVEMIRKKGISVKMLFLEASDQVLIKRYKETRRAHPLSGSDRIEEGIRRERELVEFLKDEADYIIDTSELLTKELRQELEKIFLKDQAFRNLMITVLSFGFKNGLPADADLVFDVRFLPNPYYVQSLRHKTGNDTEVQKYVMDSPVSREFLKKLEDMIRFLIPYYIEEGKNRLVIAIGCTGGHHRSVTVANELYRRLSGSAQYGITLEHRDISRE